MPFLPLPPSLTNQLLTILGCGQLSHSPPEETHLNLYIFFHCDSCVCVCVQQDYTFLLAIRTSPLTLFSCLPQLLLSLAGSEIHAITRLCRLG